MSIIKLENASVVKQGRCILDGIDFSFDGGTAAIYGTPKSGKTTLCDAVSGAVRLTEGTRTCTGRIAVISGEAGLFPELTIEKNIALYAAGGRSVGDSMKYAGITDFGGARPGNLDFGKNALAKLACALASAPDMLLCDDCEAGLSGAERDKILELILNSGLPAVIITGSRKSAARCDESFVLEDGRLGKMVF